MTTLAKIWNLADPTEWSAGGTNAKPRLGFAVYDPDGDPIASVILRIYTASSGGTAAQTHTLTGATLTAAIAAGYYDSSYGMKNIDQASSERWLTIEATDSYGESSGESIRYGFKVCWGQAIFQHDPGASSSLWAHTAGTVTNGQDSAFLYRSALTSGGGTPSPWVTSLSEVPENVYVNILVRLSAHERSAAPEDTALPDMVFSYTADAQTPDHWVASPADDWSLDSSKYRAGTKAYRAVVDSNVDDYFCYPLVNGEDLAVQPNTAYVLSAVVAANRNLVASLLSLRVYAGGGMTTLLVQGAVGSDAHDEGSGATSDPTGDVRSHEGWLRIHVHFTTGPGTTSIRPVIYYDNGGAGNGDQFWVDTVKLEEGIVVTPWQPSFLSTAATLDAYGISVDASAGGSFRLRHSNGTDTVATDEVVEAVLGGGGGGGGPSADDLIWIEPGGLSDLVTWG